MKQKKSEGPRMVRFGARAAVLGACLCMAACAIRPTAPEPRHLTLASPSHADNDMLSRRYAGKLATNPNCVGDNLSPALAWTRVPAGTRSFAIVLDDQAGRAGLGVNHWTAYGIPASVGGLAEGEASAPSKVFVHGKNTGGAAAYLGPCPPQGNAPQHYVFTLIATKLAPDALPPGLSRTELMQALQGQTLGAASFVLRFSH
ncbi:MAG: YbhB/YbcL family Raf kinase inhibitor-like protein [Pseudomonadota bacterium]